MDIHARLKEMGYEMPALNPAVASYVPFKISGNHVYISGQIPVLNGAMVHAGMLGKSVTLEQGQKAAQACALNILAVVNEAVQGDWSRVQFCLKLGGFVNAAPDFTDHSKVINGASDIMAGTLGESGKHTRFAIGVSSLPLGSSVEVDAIFEITP
jgi:enamine deaminase RidA (YjgF/YER057c/UK114 family)